MRLGMVGLGRMGGAMAARLLRGGHELVVYDPAMEAARRLAEKGAQTASSLAELVLSLPTPRVIWVMVPAGEATERTLGALGENAKAGDILIDGGNSHYKDTVRRSALLHEKGLTLLDCGTSGGVWGGERGYCLMVGGDPKAFRQVEPILKTLAPGKGTLPRTPGRPEGVGTAEEGYLHCGPSGSGHFVKMVHNGIEYGLMQAYAEGFDLLKNAASPTLPTERRYDLPLDEIAELWRRGSVVSSWLLDLGAAALKDDPALSRFEGRVADSGEGRWALETAHELGVLAPVLDASLQERVRSREAPFYADKFLSALRERFGGHGEAPR